MASGSYSRESARDCQCENCGRWYDRSGIKSHERNCQHPEDVDPIVPLEESSPSTDDLREEIPAEVVDEDDQEIVVDEEDDVEEILSDHGVLEPDPTAATDGGGGGVKPLPTPETGVETGGSSTKTDSGEDLVECPNCGCSRVYPVDDLPDFVQEVAITSVIEKRTSEPARSRCSPRE
jgi:hypothetical protein